MATPEGAGPARQSDDHVQAAGEDPGTGGAPEDSSDPTLIEVVARVDAALIWANEAVAQAAEAVERSQRHIEDAQSELDRQPQVLVAN